MEVGDERDDALRQCDAAAKAAREAEQRASAQEQVCRRALGCPPSSRELALYAHSCAYHLYPS